jgi:hypothetical protein
LHKVKFFSADDSSCNYYLPKAENIMNSFDPNKATYTINEIIEFHNISKYIHAEVYLKSWSIEDVAKFKDMIVIFKGIIGKFFNSISDNKIMDLFNAVDGSYRRDFWNLIEKFKVYKSVSADTFNNLLVQSNVGLYEVLTNKSLVNYYGEYIKKQLLLDETAAKFLLDKYEINRHNNQKSEIHLPKELSKNDVEIIILNYIKSSDPNLNYLRIIANVQSSNEFSISDRIRLQARRRVEDEESKLFNKNSGITTEFRISFSDKQDEEVVKKVNSQKCSFSYSLRWLKNNTEYNTLLNNFIYLFYFTDLQMRINFVNKVNEMGVLERDIVMISKNAYPIGYSFACKDRISLLQMSAYYEQLDRLSIRLEDIIEWFFKNYMSEEFKVTDFRIKMPSEHSLYIEKCRAILPEMESILKQFSLYVEDKAIDHELLQISSEHLLYKNIPSLIDKKYVYGKNNEFEQVTFYFFSDQCMLSYFEGKKSKAKTFFELLKNEKISIDDYPDYWHSDINWLIQHKYIELDKDGFIKYSDINRIYILKDLYDNETINYYRYSMNLREVIDDMKKNDIVEIENTLFSRTEQDYFNYYLNKSCFNNALDLRNKYSHGTQPSSDESEAIHKSNYFIFLRLFILIIIKINDEFCLSYNQGIKENAE